MSDWRPIPGYEGRYEVSADGRVRSKLRGGLTLSQVLTAEGYLQVTLWAANGAQRTVLIHAVVSAAFIGPRPNGLVIRHLDGDSLNNDVSNLAFGTSLENVLDTLRHGRHRGVAKTHCPQGHPYDEANTYWRGTWRHCRPCNRAAVARY